MCAIQADLQHVNSIIYPEKSLHGPADASTNVEPELVTLISSALSSLPVSDFDRACSSCSEMVALRDSGGQSTQIKYLSKSTDTYNKILLQ